MNKILLIALITWAPFITIGQINSPNPALLDSSGNFYYSEVVDVDSTSAAELFSRAKLMVATIYNSGKDVTQLNDDAEKRVVTKGNFIINEPIFLTNAEMHINLQMILQCKDGRYKVDLETQGYTGSVNTYYYREVTLNERPKNWSQKKWTEVITKAKQKMTEVVILIKKDMASKLGNNW